MATPAAHFLHLKLKLFAAVFGILIISGSGQATAELPNANQCGVQDGLAVLVACTAFIKKEGPKEKPSSTCCEGVTKIGMPCACKVVTKEIESTISMEKLLFVAQSCGAPLRPGTMCGSYKVPPA